MQYDFFLQHLIAISIKLFELNRYLGIYLDKRILRIFIQDRNETKLQDVSDYFNT